MVPPSFSSFTCIICQRLEMMATERFLALTCLLSPEKKLWLLLFCFHFITVNSILYQRWFTWQIVLCYQISLKLPIFYHCHFFQNIPIGLKWFELQRKLFVSLYLTSAEKIEPQFEVHLDAWPLFSATAVQSQLKSTNLGRVEMERSFCLRLIKLLRPGFNIKFH